MVEKVVPLVLQIVEPAQLLPEVVLVVEVEADMSYPHKILLPFQKVIWNKHNYLKSPLQQNRI